MWEQALRRLGALSVTLNPIHGNKHTDREAGVGGTGRFITHQYDICGGWGGGGGFTHGCHVLRGGR